MNHIDKKTKKVLFVATVVKKHIMEFHIPYLKMFKEMGWETAVAAKNDYENPADCMIPYCDCYYDIPFERSPIKKQNVKAYVFLKRVIGSGNYDIVHCHTPVGGILTRIAAQKSRKSGLKVIYTAHGFHFYKGAPLMNWLLYYPIEWFCSWWTDLLITINQEDYKRAKNKLHAKRVEYVPGVGVDISKFELTSVDVEEKKKRLGIPKDAIIVLSVSAINEDKNQKVVIDAITRIQNRKTHCVIAGPGNLEETLKEQVQKLRISDRVHLLEYRKDVAELFQCADVFVHLSYQENLLFIMEAMAAKVPIICSNICESRGLIDEEWKFQPDDGEKVKVLINRIISMSADEHEEIIIRNYEKIKAFDLGQVKWERKKICEEGALQRLIFRQNMKKSLGIPYDAFVLTSVGELNRNKNHMVIIRALEKVNNSKIHYIIVGTGDGQRDLQELAKYCGVDNQVHLLGYRKDVPALYRCSDVCVFPSIREGLGLAAIEGMASGLPLLCSNNRGTKSFSYNGENAYVCECQDIEKFGDAINKLYHNPGLRDRWGKKNIKIARAFDVKNINVMMSNLYQELE